MATNLTEKNIETLRKYGVDWHLYTLTQDELREHIKYILDHSEIPYKEYGGNILSLTHPGAPVFCAHMDTVKDRDMKLPFIVSGGLQNFDEMDFFPTLSREGGILGADDRSGVNMILNHMYDINFIFTVDEERGHIGMSSIVRDPKTLNDIQFCSNFMVFIDRRNGTDLIATQNGYCCEDLENAIEKVTFLKSTQGFACDADAIKRHMPCVNMSSAYYNPHNNGEFLNLREFEALNNEIPAISRITGNFKIKNPAKSVFDSGIQTDSKNSLKQSFLSSLINKMRGKK